MLREQGDNRARLSWVLRPHFAPLAIAVLLLIGLTGVNLIVPQLVAIVFNRVFDEANWTLLWVVLGAMLVLYIARNLLYFYSKFSAVRVGENVAFELRKRLFERLQQMNLQYYRSNKPGQLSSRVMNDSFVIQQFIQDEMPKLLQAGLLFTGLIAVMYAMNWQLALASTIVLPLHLAAFHYFKGPIKAASRHAQEHMAEATGNLIEKLLGMEVVKGFTAEQRETEAFQHAIDASRQSQLRSKKFHVGQKVAADLLIGLGMIGLIGFGAYQVMHGDLRVGGFVAFFWYIKMLYPTVLELMNGFAKMTKASAGVDRVAEVLQSRGVEETETDTGKTPAIHGRLCFEDVSFRYPGTAPVLRHINFEIAPGEVLAIVGPSGAGKSTLVNLVPRFHEPEQGRLLVDGHNARELDLRHLRQAIGMAFQECFLFNSSILENLRYARPKASRREIMEVARRTGAHEFIMRLPHKYDTLVGENGVTLSRGQKQLINLTRAMLKNPHILVLDEATASIDEARESQVIPAILEFMQGKTTLMITHRPEMLKHADKVLQLAEGEVVYFGPTQEAPSMSPTPSATDTAATTAPQTPETVPPERAPWRDDDAPHDDRPEARPSSSGIWRGLPVLLLGALLGANALIGTPTPRVAAQSAEKPATQPTTAPTQEQNEQQNQAQNRSQNQDKRQSKGEGEFMPLPDLSRVEAKELLAVITSRAKAELGYRRAAQREAQRLPRAPVQLQARTTLSREADGARDMLQLGFRTFVSQPTHLWLYGATFTEGAVRANDDLARVQKMVQAARQSGADKAEQMTVGDLKMKRIKLSYIGTGRALGVLKSLGYQTIEYKPGQKSAGKSEIINPTSEVNPKKLPIVVSLPGSKAVDLVAGAEQRQGTFGLTSTPSVASELPDSTSAARQMELLVLYDPAEPEQLGDVVTRVRQHIDVPAQQLLIEAMVLEISETGLEKLGVDWELTTPFSNHHNLDNISDLKFGRLPQFSSRNNEQPTYEMTIDDFSNHWRVQVEALVRDGQAEVLSRPSVLTLDNRQASLRVGEEIPVAKSFRGVSGGDNVQLDFAYIPVGILLNVRPRISARAEEISLQIDGVVSAQVPGEDLVIRDDQGNELGRAPRISTRRVQTYARVGNNTPFIIGGLVSKNNTREVDKVPILGDIPIIKHAFRSVRVDELKREVIIVLTPYVLPENQVVGRNLPKDEDAFDSFGNQLFRDAYRIRAEDVFDLSFLTQNAQLQKMQRLADRVVSGNPALEQQHPFNRFANGRIPGERVLVFRQMYEVIKRKELTQQLGMDQIIFFEPDASSESGFSVAFLDASVARLAQQAWAKQNQHLAAHHAPDDPFEALRQVNKAIAMTFTRRERASEAGEILEQPVAKLRLVDCSGGGQWSQLLWELNQPDEQGRPRHTVLIREQENLTRVKRALMLKRTVELNATQGSLTLNNFTVGRQLLMPTVKQEKMYLIDADAAEYFFLTEQYYPALQKKLQESIGALKRRLRQPRYQQYLQKPVSFDNKPSQTLPDRMPNDAPEASEQTPRDE